ERSPADPRGGHELEVVQPDVGVEAALGGDAAQSGDAAGNGVIRGEREEAAVELMHRIVGVVLVHHGARGNFTPAWMFGSSSVMSPTCISRPVAHHLHEPDRAGGAPGVLLSSDS